MNEPGDTLEGMFERYRERFGEEPSEVAKDGMRRGYEVLRDRMTEEEYVERLWSSVTRGRDRQAYEQEIGEITEGDENAIFFAGPEGEHQGLFLRIADHLRKTYRAEVRESVTLAAMLGMEIESAFESFESGASTADINLVVDPPYENVFPQDVHLVLKPDGSFEDVSGKAKEMPTASSGCTPVLVLLFLLAVWVILRSW